MSLPRLEFGILPGWVLVSLALVGPALADSGGDQGVLTAGFVCTTGVYNTELTAPWDVLEHTRYRDDENYIRCILITEDGDPLRTAEGLRIEADASFEDCPDLDILLIPSSEGSMGVDLENERFLGFLRARIPAVDWVITLCDGAFPLAATGHLDGRVATTFPGDRQRLAAAFPKVDVRHDVRFVVDGKFITSTGGAPSFEPAFYLVERLYGRDHALRSARGLVFPWGTAEIPHLTVPDRY